MVFGTAKGVLFIEASDHVVLIGEVPLYTALT